jgi:hypothetical protein
MAEGSWRLRSLKYNCQGLINALAWSNGFFCEIGKRGGMHGRKIWGPMQRNVAIILLWQNLFRELYTQFFTLGKAHHKVHLSTSICCNESWEASLPTMCLDHIIAHETYHFFHALPLKLAPTCFIKQCGTSRTQEFECRSVFLVY